ncbi:DUF6684 family protein [Halococcus agarilyticus]|uniref:DUF6684 family protein n=1 Tax=Halococcus agarilyticus TaxID=1232219 RepID=UPI000677D0BE|nr:DUF6684 family protein [Halococcus agarilyticus]
MAERVFDRETLLDLTVNVIPLGMLLFFVLLFAVTTVGSTPIATVVSQALLVVPFVVLTGTTYLTGRIIAESQKTGHSETATAIAAFATGERPDADDEA